MPRPHGTTAVDQKAPSQRHGATQAIQNTACLKLRHKWFREFVCIVCPSLRSRWLGCRGENQGCICTNGRDHIIICSVSLVLNTCFISFILSSQFFSLIAAHCVFHTLSPSPLPRALFEQGFAEQKNLSPAGTFA